MAYHTYEFLRKRRNDPKWRDAYQSALIQRLIGVVFILLVLIGILLVYRYDIDVMHYVNLVADKIKDIIDGFMDKFDF